MVPFRKLWYSFLFASHRNYGRILTVSTQYTNVTDTHAASQTDIAHDSKSRRQLQITSIHYVKF